MVHVCSAHPADDGRVFRRACVSLAEAGYEVHLIARSSETSPFVRDGVHIHPVPWCREQLKRMARRGAIARMAADLKPDLFHVHEPELLGATISVARSKPVVYDVHESYLDVLMDRAWIPKPIRPLVRRAWDLRERALLAKCAAVVPVTDVVAARYLPLHRTVVVVANYPELRDLLALPTVERDGRTCVFTGTIHANRGLHQAVSAVSLLRRRGLDVPLVIAGSATPEFLRGLTDHARDGGVVDLVTYKGILPRSEAIAVANAASIGLVPHLPYGNNLAAWPVKMMEYMALGLPIVYSSLPSHEMIAAGRGLGISVDAQSPEALADAIQSLITDGELARTMGEAGRSAARSLFNWEAEKGKLIALYTELLSSSPR